MCTVTSEYEAPMPQTTHTDLFRNKFVKFIRSQKEIKFVKLFARSVLFELNGRHNSGQLVFFMIRRGGRICVFFFFLGGRVVYGATFASSCRQIIPGGNLAPKNCS